MGDFTSSPDPEINSESQTEAPSVGGTPNSTPHTQAEDDGNGPRHAKKLLIGGLAELAIVGGGTFQMARALPKPFFITYVASFLVLAVLDLVLLLLFCKGGGPSLTRFARGYAEVMVVLVLLLPLILKAYMAFEN